MNSGAINVIEIDNKYRLENFYPHHRSNLAIGFMNIIFKLDLSLEKRNPLLDGLPTTPAKNLFISSKIKSPYL